MKYSRFVQKLAIALLPHALWRRFYLGRPGRPCRKAPWSLGYDFRVRSCASKLVFGEMRFFPYGVGYVLERPCMHYFRYGYDDMPF